MHAKSYCYRRRTSAGIKAARCFNSADDPMYESEAGTNVAEAKIWSC